MSVLGYTAWYRVSELGAGAKLYTYTEARLVQEQRLVEWTGTGTEFCTEAWYSGAGAKV